MVAAFFAADGQRASGSGPREAGFFVGYALRFGLRFGQPHPCDLGIGVCDGRNSHGFERGMVSGDDFGGDLAFVRRLVRQHRIADDVADRIDVRHVGAHLDVHRDEAALVDGHTGGIRTDVASVGTPPDGHQHTVIQLRLGCLFAFKVHFQACLLGFDLADLGLQVDCLVAFLDALVQRLDQILVGAGHQLVHQFDHAEILLPSASYTVAISSPMMPPPMISMRFGTSCKCQRAGGVDDARIVIGEAGDARHAGAGRDDCGIEADGFLAVLGDHFQVVGRGEFRRALHHLHLALLGQRGQARR